MRNLEKIDAENEEFYTNSYEAVVKGKYTIKDILGFDLKNPKVFIPRAPCSHIAPSVYKICGGITEKPSTSILTLLPLYNTLVYPISPSYEKGKMTEASFEKANDLPLKDFTKAVEMGKIIPYFYHYYKEYDKQFLEPFMEPGLPRISLIHMELVRRMSACKLANGDCEACGASIESATKDMSLIRGNYEESALESCIVCLARAYNIGVRKETLLKSKDAFYSICALMDILASRNIEATIQTNCPIAKDALGLFHNLPTATDAIDTIVKGLKVKYTNDLDFESYLGLLDGKTTRAIKKVTEKILEDPFALKYSERLNAKIYEFNQEIEEVAKSKTTKFYHAVSDIAVYGGSKYVESRSKGYLHLGKKRLEKASEWLASKLMDYHARVTGKDWTIAQLYRTRVKIEQCRGKLR